MRNVYLIGFMGAGKSTVGRILGEALGMEFLDTDQLVVERAGLPIPEIFSRFGEKYFRELEREVIDEIAGKRGLVVALGGGAPMDDENWRRLRGSGVTVYLRESPEVLAERLADDDTRPLLVGHSGEARKERIRSLLASREPRYLEADVVVECRGRRPEDIAAEIIRRLGDAGLGSEDFR
jgi:shikimate kinase